MPAPGVYFHAWMQKALKRASIQGRSFQKKHTRPLRRKMQLSPSVLLAGGDGLEWGEVNGQFRSVYSTYSAADLSTAKRAGNYPTPGTVCPLCLTVGETFISKIFPVCVGYRGIRNPAPAPPTPRGGPLFLASPPSPIPRPHNVSGSFMQTEWFPTREKYSLNGPGHLLGRPKCLHAAGAFGITAPLFATKKPPPRRMTA